MTKKDPIIYYTEWETVDVNLQVPELVNDVANVWSYPNGPTFPDNFPLTISKNLSAEEILKRYVLKLAYRPVLSDEYNPKSAFIDDVDILLSDAKFESIQEADKKVDILSGKYRYKITVKFR